MAVEKSSVDTKGSGSVASNDWTPLDVALTLTSEFRALRPALALGTSTLGNGGCNFDSVSLVGPPNFADVPTLGSSALAALATALALAGLFWLRRPH